MEIDTNNLLIRRYLSSCTLLFRIADLALHSAIQFMNVVASCCHTTIEAGDLDNEVRHAPANTFRRTVHNLQT